LEEHLNFNLFHELQVHPKFVHNFVVYGFKWLCIFEIVFLEIPCVTVRGCVSRNSNPQAEGRSSLPPEIAMVEKGCNGLKSIMEDIKIQGSRKSQPI
jgi:hypothetical protein